MGDDVYRHIDFHVVPVRIDDRLANGLVAEISGSCPQPVSRATEIDRIGPIVNCRDEFLKTAGWGKKFWKRERDFTAFVFGSWCIIVLALINFRLRLSGEKWHVPVIRVLLS